MQTHQKSHQVGLPVYHKGTRVSHGQPWAPGPQDSPDAFFENPPIDHWILELHLTFRRLFGWFYRYTYSMYIYKWFHIENLVLNVPKLSGFMQSRSRESDLEELRDIGVCLKIVCPHFWWFIMIVPLKLASWGYAPFSDKPTWSAALPYGPSRTCGFLLLPYQNDGFQKSICVKLQKHILFSIQVTTSWNKLGISAWISLVLR